MAATATSTCFCFSPPFHHQTHRKHPQHQHELLLFKPSSRDTILSSPTSIKASSTLLQTTTTKNHPENTNTEISRLCEMGDLRNAMNLLLCNPHSSKSKLELKTYCSILQLCAEHKSLYDGKRIHSIISSLGILIDGVLGCKLVFMYLTCGDLIGGRRVFDEMVVNEKVFLWNLMMNGYAKVGDFRESIRLFIRMKESGVRPNEYSFSIVFKCFAALTSVLGGEETHGYLLKLGYGSYSTVVGNALISFYSKCRKMDSARTLFENLSERDVISWNSIIGGYVSNGFPEEGLHMLTEMRFSGVDADLITVVSIVQACVEMGDLFLGRAVHGFVIKGISFKGEVALSNCLLDMYGKCGDLISAERIFGEMGKKNVVSWTSMISGYAREEQCDRAVEMLREMGEKGVKPDLLTVTSILHAFWHNRSPKNVEDIHGYIMRNGLQSNLYVTNALIDAYAKGGRMEDARSVFDQMKVRDVITWNTIIGCYSKNSLFNEALGLLIEMQLKFKPNGVTMTCVLPACASLSALERGQEIHGYVLRNGFYSDIYISNALVDMYAKCGALPHARLLFNRVPVKDLVSWTVMIAGYGMHGSGKDAIALFSEMRATGITLQEVSFIAILYACSRSGLLDEGWRFFNIMRNDYKIEPKLEHYACMVSLLARAGRLTKAYKFIEAMPIAPDSKVWGALLCGCRIHRDVELAEKVAEKVFELDPENTEYYTLLASIYLEAEKWEEVKKIWAGSGGRRGIRKNIGYSWIEIKKKVHVFVEGDKSHLHPQSKRIELFLERARMRMKEEGCVSKKNYGLDNASNKIDKEEAICGHSEKLAMAYGVLNSPPGKTVRVTKNLRVCGDCHEMGKFLSNLEEKEIFLRDSSGFHHFKHGRCSCRGYW
ncbi:hypothetical protein GIB67_025244 [Kingdonia uniflora]|uniref:DYW domain-containing protein n=1 Tax=Kingdonia uniflora TaxID=39325 RepID=A0A7J7NC40_9MAGN|nr:hypothetical protein GIB67_025244 [Kingdonia uniflora]